MAKDDEDRVAAHAVATSAHIDEDTDTAADTAAEEAEAAGVSPHAVMRSAPEGYATGLGDKWEGIHVPADENEGNAGTGPDHPTRAVHY